MKYEYAFTCDLSTIDSRARDVGCEHIRMTMERRSFDKEARKNLRNV